MNRTSYIRADGSFCDPAVADFRVYVSDNPPRASVWEPSSMNGPHDVIMVADGRYWGAVPSRLVVLDLPAGETHWPAYEALRSALRGIVRWAVSVVFPHAVSDPDPWGEVSLAKTYVTLEMPEAAAVRLRDPIVAAQLTTAIEDIEDIIRAGRKP